MDAARGTLWIRGKALWNDAGRYCRRFVSGATRIGSIDVSVPIAPGQVSKAVARRYDQGIGVAGELVNASAKRSASYTKFSMRRPSQANRPIQATVSTAPITTAAKGSLFPQVIN
jgi:hypothetical protein